MWGCSITMYGSAGSFGMASKRTLGSGTGTEKSATRVGLPRKSWNFKFEIQISLSGVRHSLDGGASHRKTSHSFPSYSTVSTGNIEEPSLTMVLNMGASLIGAKSDISFAPDSVGTCQDSESGDSQSRLSPLYSAPSVLSVRTDCPKCPGVRTAPHPPKEHIANIEQIVYSAVLAMPGQGPLRCWPPESRP